MYDIIGDIHGHASQLNTLLTKLGYTKQNGAYTHSDRKVLFLGDYIDRGPQIRETLEIVKAMTDQGHAMALMGNHEYNAVCFHLQESEGGHLRKHEIKNIIQHWETLRQFRNRQKEYESYIDWFTTLPLCFETDLFRAVHACWSYSDMAFLQKHLKDGRLSEEQIVQSVRRESPFFTAVNHVLKGIEARLPEGHFFLDKDETPRTRIRARWWEDPAGMTYKSLSVEPIDSLPDVPVDLANLSSTDSYRSDDKMVFFGHYWLKGKPRVFHHNACCLDYSVAKNGHLAAYRHNGEARLDPANLVYV